MVPRRRSVPSELGFKPFLTTNVLVRIFGYEVLIFGIDLSDRFGVPRIDPRPFAGTDVLVEVDGFGLNEPSIRPDS